MSSLRLAVVRDFQAEGWLSMDLCADQLLAHLPANLTVTEIAPKFRRCFGQLSFLRRTGFNADRLLNRHVLLPRVVRIAAHRGGFVHIADHSYAHLVKAVPSGRAGVYCHDLDAFRSVLEPDKAPRPWWFRRLARRTLDGLRQAAVVFHNSVEVGRQLLEAGIVSPSRLVHVPLGVATEFTAVSTPSMSLPIQPEPPFLLHVGSTAPRKRLDILLDVYAAVREKIPGLHLIQIGGPWWPSLAERLARLGPTVTQARGLSREQLAELYRRAAAVLVPSDAEGFGLPVIEALACGAIVIASDLATLREAGGDAANYCTVADIPAWAETVTRVLTYPDSAPPREKRLAHAAKFSWREHARVIAETYLRLAE